MGGHNSTRMAMQIGLIIVALCLACFSSLLVQAERGPCMSCKEDKKDKSGERVDETVRRFLGRPIPGILGLIGS